MAKVSVIRSIEESYELIKEHYKEVLIPLIFLMLLSGAGSMGGSSYSSRGGSGGKSVDSGSLVANAMADSGALVSGLGALLVIIIVAVVIFVIAFAILDRAIWFYVFEHFYSLLTKRKLPSSWQERMKANTLRSAVLYFFGMFLLLLFIVVPMVISYFMLNIDLSQGIWALMPLLWVFIAVLLLFLAISFMIMPLWIYYAMDRLPFWESLSRAFSLVRDNFITFVKFTGIFLVIGVAAIIGIIMTCCFAFITSPIITVFLQLLSGVTLMKLRLALDKK